MEELRAAFDSLDTNKDGVVDRDEWSNAAAVYNRNSTKETREMAALRMQLAHAEGEVNRRLKQAHLAGSANQR